MWCRYRARTHTEDIWNCNPDRDQSTVGADHPGQPTSVDRCPNPSVQYTPTQPVVIGSWVIVNSCYNQSLNHYTITGLCLCSLENLIAVVSRFGLQPTPKSPSLLHMYIGVFIWTQIYENRAFVHVHVKVYLCYFTQNVTFINCVLIFVITKKKKKK